jgi:hypothetical protein
VYALALFTVPNIITQIAIVIIILMICLLSI